MQGPASSCPDDTQQKQLSSFISWSPPESSPDPYAHSPPRPLHAITQQGRQIRRQQLGKDRIVVAFDLVGGRVTGLAVARLMARDFKLPEEMRPPMVDLLLLQALECSEKDRLNVLQQALKPILKDDLLLDLDDSILCGLVEVTLLLHSFPPSSAAAKQLLDGTLKTLRDWGYPPDYILVLQPTPLPSSPSEGVHAEQALQAMWTPCRVCFVEGQMAWSGPRKKIEKVQRMERVLLPAGGPSGPGGGADAAGRALLMLLRHAESCRGQEIVIGGEEEFEPGEAVGGDSWKQGRKKGAMGRKRGTGSLTSLREQPQLAGGEGDDTRGERHRKRLFSGMLRGGAGMY